MALKLFRRHQSTCTKGYAKEERLYENGSARRTGKAQCNCTIYAEGKLSNGEYLKPKSTGFGDFAQASVAAQQLDQTPTAKTVAEDSPESSELVPFAQAIDDFLLVTAGNGAKDRRIVQYRQLLNLRLLPFAAVKRKVFIQEADNARFWSDFG